MRRAVWLMALLVALAMAGLGYATVFMAEYPLNVSQFRTRFVNCLFGFLILGVVCKELDQRREDCRRLAVKVFESRLGPASVRVVPSRGQRTE